MISLSRAATAAAATAAAATAANSVGCRSRYNNVSRVGVSLSLYCVCGVRTLCGAVVGGGIMNWEPCQTEGEK